MNKTLPIIILTILLTACVSPPRFTAANTELPPCGVLPNCVHSDARHKRHAIAPLQANQAQWQAFLDWLATQDQFSIVKQQTNFIQFVATTSTLRFRDDVQLLYQPETTTIHVRSSSRLGISDMGANRKRIEFLRQTLATLL